MYLKIAGESEHAYVVGEVQHGGGGLRLLHAGGQHSVAALHQAHRVVAHRAVWGGGGQES